MKTRQAFVANSSSSSFIIAFRDLEKVEGYENLPTFAKKFIAIAMKRISNGSKIKTKEELDAYFISRYGWGSRKSLDSIFEDDGCLKDEYEECLTYINDGYIISENSVDNCDEVTGEFYGSLPREDNGDGIILIKGDC